MGPYGSVWIRMGQYGSGMGPYRSVKVRMGPYVHVSLLYDAIDAVRTHTDIYGHIWKTHGHICRHKCIGLINYL